MNASLIARVVAGILIVAGAVIVATSGESIAVRFLTAIVTADIAVRLLVRSGLGASHRSP